jgi:hypothetical protein
MTRAFDADFGLHQLSRADLCTLGRERLLAGHLQDRGSIPAVLRHHPMDEAYEIAIEEWMTASPVYTRRIQRLLGFAGDDVTTIFKGLQLDIGFPHQFMDVGYELHSRDRGEFWLRTCGALADVMPMGEGFVHGMCHTIEDPTFDATAVATNPRAQVRPIHRPPGIPRGGPACHWTVLIDPQHNPVEPHPRLAQMQRSVLAGLPNDPVDTLEPGGWPDYSGAFEPDFELEHLSHRALQIAVREFAIQGHLLARALMLAVDHHDSPDRAVEAGRALFTGIAWIAAERIHRALGTGDDLAGLANTLQMTHLLGPVDYAGLTVTMPDADTVTLTLSPHAGGLAEGDPYSLPGLLRIGSHEIVEALVHGVNPAATVSHPEPSDSNHAETWTITAPPDAKPASEPAEVRTMRFSTGPASVLIRRRPLITGSGPVAPSPAP